MALGRSEDGPAAVAGGKEEYMSTTAEKQMAAESLEKVLFNYFYFSVKLKIKSSAKSEREGVLEI